MSAPPKNAVTYSFGDFEVIPEDGILIRRGLKVRLQDQPFRLLVLLVSRSGTVVTRQDIQSHLWPANTNVEFDQSLRVAMSKLREALRDPTDRPLYIETIPRRGYRFTAHVTAKDAPPSGGRDLIHSSASEVETLPNGLPYSAAPTAATSSSGSTGTNHAGSFLSRTPRFAWALALLAVIAGSYFIRRATHRAVTSTVAASPEARRSVAVLGLRNLDGRPEDRWLSTALAEMLSTELATSEHIRVISGEQIARAGLAEPLATSPSRETLARIAKQLGADLLIFGSYTVSTSQGTGPTSQLRVDIHMENPSSDSPPFALVETGVASDVFAVVSASGAELRQRLGLGEATAGILNVVRRTLPSDMTAAQFYAEGLDRLRVFDALHARDLLQRAAAIDPTHAATFLALSDAWHGLGYDKEARTAAARAVELSSGLSREESLLIQGQSAQVSHDWQHAIDIFRTLSTFYPDTIDYGIRLARIQVNAGKVQDALATLQDIRHRQPSQADDAHIALAEAYALLHHNDYPQALAAAGRAIQIGTELDQNLVRAEGFWMKASSLERMGKDQESLQASSEAQNLYRAGGDLRGVAITLLASGDVLYDQGKTDEARKEFLTALNHFRIIGSTINMGVTLERIGNCYFDEGKLAESRDFYQQSLDAYRAVPWEEGIPSAIGNIANVLDEQGDIAGALRLNQEGLEQFEQTGQQRGYAATLDNMGNLEMERGGLAAASKYYDRAAEVYTKIAYARGIASALVGQAEILIALDKPDSAIALDQKALAAIKNMDEPLIAGSVQLTTGIATLLSAHPQPAVPQLQQGINLALKSKNHDLAAEGCAWLTRAWLQQGRIHEAAAAAAQAVDESHKQFAPRPQLIAAMATARVQIAQGNMVQARDGIQSTVQTAQRYNYSPMALESRMLLARTEPSAAERRRQLNALSIEAHQHGWKMLATDTRSATP